MIAPINSLASLQRTVAIALTILAFVHVPVLIVLAWLRGYGVPGVTGLSLILAGAPALLLVAERPIVVVGAALAVALVAQTSLLVYLMEGHPCRLKPISIISPFWRCCRGSAICGYCCWLQG